MICLIITKYFLLHLNIVNNLKLTAEIGQRSHAVWHMFRKLLTSCLVEMLVSVES